MELRSGTIVNTTTVPTWVPTLDGEDYIPHTVTEEFPWDWSVRLREYIEEDNWCPETAYYFVDFLDRTSNDWVDICFAPTSRNDTKSFGETLMNIVYQFEADAQGMLTRPRTREHSQHMQDNHGFYHGLVRTAHDLKVTWVVAKNEL